jgi:hypothetical protein
MTGGGNVVYYGNVPALRMYSHSVISQQRGEILDMQ